MKIKLSITRKCEVGGGSLLAVLVCGRPLCGPLMCIPLCGGLLLLRVLRIDIRADGYTIINDKKITSVDQIINICY